MPYRKIKFDYDLNQLHADLAGLDYSSYIDVKDKFLRKARAAGYTEKRLHVFWARVRRKLKQSFGYELPLSNDWKNVRMRIYRQHGTTRL
jgi:hypothetical protein